jgi:glycosyltransferase involved in cell wall biosynthesis
MKILIATGVYPPESGGPATYSKLLEDRLPALGIEVKVLPFSTVRRLPKVLRHLAYFLRCAQLSRGCSIVYAQDPVSVGLPAWLAAALTGKKFAVRLGGDYAWEQGRQRAAVAQELDEFQRRRYGLGVEFLRAVQKFVVGRARAVVVPSEYMKKIVSAWTAPGKVHRIYSSIALPPPYELPQDRPEGFLVLSFGRRVPWKGFEALERVAARDPSWNLKIFSEIPYPKAMGWLKAADVYVNNSTYEGLSHQVVEAMALGTPVVATRAGGNPELIEDGETGLLVAPNDDEALYAAIQSVHDDPEGGRRRAAKAQMHAERFSIERAIGEISALLKSL